MKYKIGTKLTCFLNTMFFYYYLQFNHLFKYLLYFYSRNCAVREIQKSTICTKLNPCERQKVGRAQN